MLKTIAGLLPVTLQHELRRYHWHRQIKHGTFSAGEPEFDLLDRFLTSGNVAIDVGANVGQYARRMAQLVGDSGRVIAFEPMAETFGLLTSNCFGLRNVTLLNLAASDHAHEVRMDLPSVGGQVNYYRASITSTGTRRVSAICLDSLPLERLDLIKIDAEGHDLSVLKGAEQCLKRFRPYLIVESDADDAISWWLSHRGYFTRYLPNSPNLIAHHKDVAPPDLTQS